MTSPTAATSAAVHAYAVAVRAALDDLTPEVRDELLDDLEAHLADVAVDVGGDLAERLGAPAAYAEELRASAGLPPRAHPARPTSAVRRAVHDAVATRVAATIALVERTPGGPATLAFLPRLRPAWWVARGWLLVLAASLATDGLMSSFPVPQLFGSAVVGFAATVVAVVVSVRAGDRQEPTRPRMRAVVAAANVLAVAGALGVASEARDRIRLDGYQVAYYPSNQTETLTSHRGPISNIYAFDAQGLPLADVQLFDQHGNPLDVLLRQAPDGRYAEPVVRFGADGRPRGNVFPRDYRVDDYDPATGGPTVRPVPRATFTAGPLAASATPSPGGTPTASPAGTPAASPGGSPAPTSSGTAAPATTPSPSPSPSSR